ncbi:MAG TPA: hypothetical protein VFR77_07450 [Steroidobacteraceae bacterium]|nr:hypothetical protein [Steroidobacteraceae bacterium]
MQISNAASSGLLSLSLASASLAQEVPPPPSPTPPIAAPAAPAAPVSSQSLVRPPVTVKCANGDHYKLTTGSNDGACKVYVDRGRILGGFCTDGSNSASQTCSTGCKEVTGSGACEKQDPSAPDGAPPGGR